MFALALICPPLYFLVVKKWGRFLFTSFLAVLSLPFMLLLVVPFIFWAISALMALYHWKSVRIAARLDQHAERIGRAVAANMSPLAPPILKH